MKTKGRQKKREKGEKTGGEREEEDRKGKRWGAEERKKNLD